MFHEVAKVVPAGVSGDAEVMHIHNSKTVQVKTWHHHPPVRPGIYCSLFIGGELFMSEAPTEWITSRPVMENAQGRVLIAGLGIGMILPSILSNPRVEHVTVVEKSADVIKLVAPHYAHPKLSVVNCDINGFVALVRYDVCFLDIWAKVSVTNLPEMLALEKKARRSWMRNKNSWIHSWSKDQILEIKAHKDRCCIRVGDVIICRRKWEDDYEDVG